MVKIVQDLQNHIYRYTNQPEKIDVLKVYSQLNILRPQDKLRVSRRADEWCLKPGGWQQGTPTSASVSLTGGQYVT